MIILIRDGQSLGSISKKKLKGLYGFYAKFQMQKKQTKMNYEYEIFMKRHYEWFQEMQKRPGARTFVLRISGSKIDLHLKCTATD